MTRRSGGVALEVWLPVLIVALSWMVPAGSQSLVFAPRRTMLEQVLVEFLSATAGDRLLPSLSHPFGCFALARSAGYSSAPQPLDARAVGPLVHFL